MNIILLVVIFWILVYALACTASWTNPGWCARFSEWSGLKIGGICYIKWQIPSIPFRLLASFRSISNNGRFVRSALSLWFDLGTISALIALILALYLFSQEATNSLVVVHRRLLDIGNDACFEGAPCRDGAVLGGNSRELPPTPRLVPIMPGYNIPASEVPVLVLSLGLCVFLHELGHAWGAIHEGVPVTGFWVFLLVLYPGAFTELETLPLSNLPVRRKLRIFCAGIWHNFVTGLVGILLLQFGLPWLLCPFYRHSESVLVAGVGARSPIGGVGGLAPGDVIEGVNHCTIVGGSRGFGGCLMDVARADGGFCIPRREILANLTSFHRSDPPGKDCCTDGVAPSPSHLCFYMKLHPLFSDVIDVEFPSNYRNQACLLARFISTFPQTCDQGKSNQSSSSSCWSHDKTAICVWPIAGVNESFGSGDSSQSVTLYRFSLAERNKGGMGLSKSANDYRNINSPVLSIGTYEDVLIDLELSDYVPRFDFGSDWWIVINFPLFIELFLKYTVTLSFGLGLINALPCYVLDGYMIVTALNELVFKPRGRHKRNTLENTGGLHWFLRLFLVYGTILLFVTIVFALLLMRL